MKLTEEKRKQRNKEILERMKDPEDKLTAFSQEQSFFPKRAIIKKDKKTIKKLFGSKEND